MLAGLGFACWFGVLGLELGVWGGGGVVTRIRMKVGFLWVGNAGAGARLGLGQCVTRM